MSLIEREAENAKKGLPAHIRAKMNSLCVSEDHGWTFIMHLLVEYKWSFLSEAFAVLKLGYRESVKIFRSALLVGEFLEHSPHFSILRMAENS